MSRYDLDWSFGYVIYTASFPYLVSSNVVLGTHLQSFGPCMSCKPPDALDVGGSFLTPLFFLPLLGSSFGQPRQLGQQVLDRRKVHEQGRSRK